MGNELAKKEVTIKSLFASKSVEERFGELLGKKAAGFITSVLQTVNSNGMLAKADPHTVLNAAATAAALDLPINNSLGYAYIIPYNTKQADGSYKTVAQFQIGYKGIKQLAQRSGQFKYINETDVKEGELEIFDRLTGEMKFNWIQDYEERKKKKTIGYVSYFELQNGFKSMYYMSSEEASQHGKKYSKNFGKSSSLWKTDFDLMALKTVSKLNLSKNAPLSIENIQTAILADQSIQRIEGQYDYDDNATVIDVEAMNQEEEEARIIKFINECETLADLEDLQGFVQEGPISDAYEKKQKELSKNK